MCCGTNDISFCGHEARFKAGIKSEFVVGFSILENELTGISRILERIGNRILKAVLPELAFKSLLNFRGAFYAMSFGKEIS
jgi:hypothetical protein